MNGSPFVLCTWFWWSGFCPIISSSLISCPSTPPRGRHSQGAHEGVFLSCVSPQRARAPSALSAHLVRLRKHCCLLPSRSRHSSTMSTWSEENVLLRHRKCNIERVHKGNRFIGSLKFSTNPLTLGVPLAFKTGPAKYTPQWTMMVLSSLFLTGLHSEEFSTRFRGKFLHTSLYSNFSLQARARSLRKRRWLVSGMRADDAVNIEAFKNRRTNWCFL